MSLQSDERPRDVIDAELVDRMLVTGRALARELRDHLAGKGAHEVSLGDLNAVLGVYPDFLKAVRDLDTFRATR